MVRPKADIARRISYKIIYFLHLYLLLPPWRPLNLSHTLAWILPQASGLYFASTTNTVFYPVLFLSILQPYTCLTLRQQREQRCNNKSTASVTGCTRPSPTYKS
ncbi:hypothetical protein K504DRAFT_215085 [Pleomassaria siparia CBS 279.74]|uniref:Uncharacterized protein n=1 Tax=Pleomassaria siparia CBS 279.74 TaxID=1314801 RepID=A0A6G1JPS2_9PLEO|nr:hypothetical protein K504DRAFT_215085 [Pleomassaria siparia CBS 279.74]